MKLRMLHGADGRVGDEGILFKLVVLKMRAQESFSLARGRGWWASAGRSPRNRGA